MNTNVTGFERRSELVKHNKMSFHVSLEDLQGAKRITYDNQYEPCYGLKVINLQKGALFLQTE